MTETVGHREDGFGGEARAVLVGAGEPRHMEELGRLATTRATQVVGGAAPGGGRGGRGAGRNAAAWRRRSRWRSSGSWSRAGGTTPATAAAASGRSSAG